MALTNGIDRQVQDKVAAYRDNPAALQKNYQINQNLLDLLALQKIKTDSEAAKRELAGSMEQNPQTIAEQRMEEVTKRTKDDLVKQVGGVAAQQQNMQQRNMQRAAAGTPPRPPGAPPGPPGARPPGPPQQMAGIAGQPAPNMARMAGGGIVSFQNGGGVRPTDNQLKRMRITRAQWESDDLTDEARAIYLDKFPVLPADASQFTKDITGIGDWFRRPAAREGAARKAQGLWGGAREIGAYFAPGPEGEATRTDLAERQARADRIRGMRPPAPGVAPAQTQAQVQPGGAQIAGADFDYSGTFPPPLDPSKKQPLPTSATPPAPSILPSTPFAPAVPTNNLANIGAARTDARDEAAEFANRAGIAAKYGTMQDRRRALSEKNAASRADSEYDDLLSRAGGQGAFANIARAASDRRERGRTQSELDLAKEQAIEQKGLAADIDIAGTAIKAGSAAGAVSQKEAARLSEIAIAKFNAKSRASIARFKAKIEKEGQEIDAEQNRQRALERNDKLLTNINTEIEKLVTKRIAATSVSKSPTPSEIKKITTEVRLAFAEEIIRIRNRQKRLTRGRWSNLTTKSKP